MLHVSPTFTDTDFLQLKKKPAFKGHLYIVNHCITGSLFFSFFQSMNLFFKFQGNITYFKIAPFKKKIPSYSVKSTTHEKQ